MRNECCERCPDKDTRICDNCNPKSDAKQDELMRVIGEKFFSLRGAIRKKHMGEQVDVKKAAIELFESSLKMVEFVEGVTEDAKIKVHS